MYRCIIKEGQRTTEKKKKRGLTPTQDKTRQDNQYKISIYLSILSITLYLYGWFIRQGYKKNNKVMIRWLE